ncbi:MAG: HAD-IA family hydrolase [Spirochaetaceae bacterium]|jgi:putative hydrolase of the HAD superfamily|nr:HAD-IA family hydrolase [Spirochaetaceae bacterium]
MPYLLFDLDDTLYPPSASMGAAIERRMIEFTASHLGIDRDAAASMRRKELAKYGTTMEWLQTEHGLSDTDGYFEYIHPESELAELSFDPELRPFLLSLDLPMSVLTNGPMPHAARVLKFLNIDDIFTGVYDILYNKLKGKPHPESYRGALKASGFNIEETVFFDDSPKYVEGFRALGGKGVLVGDREALDPKTPRVDSIYKIREYLGLV